MPVPPKTPPGEGFERVLETVGKVDLDGHRCSRCGRDFEAESSAHRKHLTRDGLECAGMVKA